MRRSSIYLNMDLSDNTDDYAALFSSDNKAFDDTGRMCWCLYYKYRYSMTEFGRPMVLIQGRVPQGDDRKSMVEWFGLAATIERYADKIPDERFDWLFLAPNPREVNRHLTCNQCSTVGSCIQVTLSTPSDRDSKDSKVTQRFVMICMNCLAPQC